MHLFYKWGNKLKLFTLKIRYWNGGLRKEKAKLYYLIEINLEKKHIVFVFEVVAGIKYSNCSLRFLHLSLAFFCY